MKLKQVVLKQYQELVNQVMTLSLPTVNEGWIRTVRKALDMSGAQLARRVGLSRAWISRTEKAELNGSVTLKTMQDLAQAMDCQFVYAFMPLKNIEEILCKQAKEKAKDIVLNANNQMALEAQALSGKEIDFEIERITKQLLEKMPSDFWDKV